MGVIMGKKTEGVVNTIPYDIWCCLCYKELRKQDCYTDTEGLKWDCCNKCAPKVMGE